MLSYDACLPYVWYAVFLINDVAVVRHLLLGYVIHNIIIIWASNLLMVIMSLS